MQTQIKKLFFITTFNSCLFTLLVIGLQNNSNKNKVNFLNGETVKLPLGFIVGSSFIAGSIIGNLFNFGLDYKNKS